MYTIKTRKGNEVSTHNTIQAARAELVRLNDVSMRPGYYIQHPAPVLPPRSNTQRRTQMNFKEYTYNIAEHWLPAIINGDESGLTDEEVTELGQFMGNFPAGAIFQPEESHNFSRDEISGQYAECYTTRVFMPST